MKTWISMRSVSRGIQLIDIKCTWFFQMLDIGLVKRMSRTYITGLYKHPIIPNVLRNWLMNKLMKSISFFLVLKNFVKTHVGFLFIRKASVYNMNLRLSSLIHPQKHTKMSCHEMIVGNDVITTVGNDVITTLLARHTLTSHALMWNKRTVQR